MTLYFIIFGHFLGARMPPIQGFSYIQYIAPGLIMMTVINSVYSGVAFTLFFMRFEKKIEELLVAPIPNFIILTGIIASGIVRVLVVGALVTLIALCFTHLRIYNAWVIGGAIFFSAILFALAGFINALFAKTFDDIAFIPTFILTPLTYLGGVFYSLHLLPGIWGEISLANPILYIVNTFRYGMLGITDVPIYDALAVLFVCCVILFIVNLHLLKKGVGIRT
jgi:ABC-2 type transport system permease protein